jgi:hypothetical protein
MTSKKKLVDTIIEELIAAQAPEPVAQKKQDGFWLPPTLPIGNGQFLAATDRMIDAIGTFTDVVMANDTDVARAYTKKDLRAVMRRAFGQALHDIDLDDPVDVNRDKVLEAVSAFLPTEFDRERIEQTFVFGCWLLRGSNSHDLQIGPVRLEDRLSWASRALDEEQISTVSKRRLERIWRGDKLARRAPSWDEGRETAVLDTIGSCPAVSSVRTSGLVAKAAEQKALLAARLAHTAVALLWTTPSTVLDGMGLLYDGDIYRQHYVILGKEGAYGASSSTSKFPGGPPPPADWNEIWSESGWMLDPVGEALSAYVAAGRPLAQPNLMNALFLSLWWFHDACREQSPLMAAVKFAASMDVLASGGKRKGITRFIEARRGNHGGAILTSGETPDELIADIYDYARSRTIHGSNDRIGHDWSQTRSRAELLARLCLRMACGWITDHPNTDDVEAMQRS